ncbi:unnamed protein product, partial [marine sediment metagenome]
MDLAHARFSCAATRTIKLMCRHGAAIGMNIRQEDLDDKTPFRCKVCIEANLKHSPAPKERTRTEQRPLKTVGSDLQTFDTMSYDGKLHLAIYADHGTGLVATVALARKNEQEQAAI